MTQYGIPLAVYADRQSTYNASAEPTLEEQRAGRHPQSPFGRAWGAWGVALIHAHSPQAQGRVERRVHPFQDWVVKERRRAGGATLAAANQCLENDLPRYNPRVTVAQATDLHRPSPASRARDRMLCLNTKRV